MVLSKDIKLAISFGLIVGCIIQIFSVFGFCSEPEVVSISIAENIGISGSDSFTYSTYNTGYFEIEPGYTYTVTVGSNYSDRNIGFSYDVPSLGVSVYDTSTISTGSSFVFTSNTYNYLYFGFYYNTGVTVTREPLVGLSGFVDTLVTNLSIEDLSGVWVLAVPVLAISVLFGLGVYFLYRLFTKIKKARGGI